MRVEQKDVIINLEDFTPFFTKVGYIVRHNAIQGKNGGLMQNGSTLVDVLAYKAEVVLPCYPLTSAQLSHLLQTVHNDVYTMLHYFDPWENDYRQITAFAEVSDNKYRGIGADGNEYWSGTEITFTEL